MLAYSNVTSFFFSQQCRKAFFPFTLSLLTSRQTVAWHVLTGDGCRYSQAASFFCKKKRKQAFAVLCARSSPSLQSVTLGAKVDFLSWRYFSKISLCEPSVNPAALQWFSPPK